MKIIYKVYAHSSKESAMDAFEAACKEADYAPYLQEMEMAKYVGMEIELLVVFDTETKEFKTEIK